MEDLVQAENDRLKAEWTKSVGRPKTTVVTGYLIFDDTVHGKPKGRKMGGLGQHYSDTDQCVVSGHCLFAGLYVLLDQRCPLEALENGRRVGWVNALLLADAGYAPLNSEEWFANLQPQVILLSVSLKDAMGLPSPEALEAVEEYNLLRTDRNGWIEITTDGEQMWVEVER